MNGRYLPPWFLQIVGLAALIALGVVWVLTDRANPLMLAAAGALALLGDYRRAGDALAQKWLANRKDPDQ
jgi:hypothetical protein